MSMEMFNKYSDEELLVVGKQALEFLSSGKTEDEPFHSIVERAPSSCAKKVLPAEIIEECGLRWIREHSNSSSDDLDHEGSQKNKETAGETDKVFACSSV